MRSTFIGFSGALRTLCRLALVGWAAVTVSAAAATAQTRAVFVSPSGNDSRSGSQATQAVRTLERAQQLLEQNRADTVYLMNGVYRRAAPLTLKPAGPRQRWMAYPGAKPTLDGKGTAASAFIIPTSNVTVSGLTLRNFKNDGIVLGSVQNVSIVDNRLENILSPTNNKAAIKLWGTGSDLLIARNRISNTGYAGIAIYGFDAVEIARVRVVGNVLTDTCQRVPDCGAIYLLGRSPNARGTVIADNAIHNYGPRNWETKAIYLDDGASESVITGNRISGVGTYAIQVHGGTGNKIRGNVIDVDPGQPALFYQTWQRSGPSAMAGNEFTNNRVRTTGGGSQVEIKYDGEARRPVLTGNRVTRRPATGARPR